MIQSSARYSILRVYRWIYGDERKLPLINLANLKVEVRDWEEGTLHSTQQTADVLLLQSSNEQVNVHACTHWEIILQLAPKGYATALHHNLQARSMYYVLHCRQLVSFLEVCWICELFILFPTLYKSHFEASSVACIVMVYVIHVSHTAALFNGMYYSNCIYNTSSSYSCLHAVILQCIHTPVLWRI